MILQIFLFLSFTLIQGWHCISLVSPKQSIYTSTINNIPLITWKNANNEWQTTVAVCNHMGNDLKKGSVVKKGCLTCSYHGHNNFPAYGHTIEQDGKIFWSKESTVRTLPPKVPFFNNPNYVHSFLEFDMDCSLEDSYYNTMDIRHPQFVHSEGFGSDLEPQNIKTFFYKGRTVPTADKGPDKGPNKGPDRVGLAFDYISNPLMNWLNGVNRTQNFHMFILPDKEPGFTWSRVTFSKVPKEPTVRTIDSSKVPKEPTVKIIDSSKVPKEPTEPREPTTKKNNLIIAVNFLPTQTLGTTVSCKWIVTICHNYHTSFVGKWFLQRMAHIILYQDYKQLRRQYQGQVKKEMLFQHTFPGEEALLWIHQKSTDKEWIKNGDFPIYEKRRFHNLKK